MLQHLFQSDYFELEPNAPKRLSVTKWQANDVAGNPEARLFPFVFIDTYARTQLGIFNVQIRRR